MSKRVGIPDNARLHGSQIKSRERVRDLAEVYTHEREVNAMLDLVPDMFPSAEEPGNIDRTFLEPACGSGNFLVEILARKLRYVTPDRYGREELFEHGVLRCLASTYGIDICEENVAEARERMTAVIVAHIDRYVSGEALSEGFKSAVQTILATNIVRADALAEAAAIELVEYVSGSGVTFVRTWSRPLDPTVGELSLFSLPEPRRDEAPVHYSDLACQPDPVPAERAEREVA